MSAPEFKNTISAGNIMTLLPVLPAIIVAITLVVYITRVDTRSQGNEIDIDRQSAQIVAIQTQINAMSITAARQDEKLVNIIGLLGEINGRLKDMEGRP